MKHVPGPWHSSTEGNGDDHRRTTGTVHAYVSAEGGIVCQTFPCENPRRAFKSGSDMSDMSEPQDGPIQRANTRLIVAAPDLLQACKLAIEIIPLIRAGMGDGHPEYTRRIRAIEAAIALATGEAQS